MFTFGSSDYSIRSVWGGRETGLRVVCPDNLLPATPLDPVVRQAILERVTTKFEELGMATERKITKTSKKRKQAKPEAGKFPHCPKGEPTNQKEQLRDDARWDDNVRQVYADFLMEKGDEEEQALGERLAKGFTNSIGMRMNFIPPGEVLQLKVTKPYYVGQFTVTQEQYERVMGVNPAHFREGGAGEGKVKDVDTRRFPVESVSWNDAVEFCRRLSEMPEEKRAGRVYRLPTEVEWEYACRAFTTTAYHYGDSISSFQANFDGNYPGGDAPRGPYLKRTCEVGSYYPNAFGLYDMHGNVWEWCGQEADPTREVAPTSQPQTASGVSSSRVQAEPQTEEPRRDSGSTAEGRRGNSSPVVGTGGQPTTGVMSGGAPEISTSPVTTGSESAVEGSDPNPSDGRGEIVGSIAEEAPPVVNEPPSAASHTATQASEFARQNLPRSDYSPFVEVSGTTENPPERELPTEETSPSDGLGSESSVGECPPFVDSLGEVGGASHEELPRATKTFVRRVNLGVGPLGTPSDSGSSEFDLDPFAGEVVGTEEQSSYKPPTETIGSEDVGTTTLRGSESSARNQETGSSAFASVGRVSVPNSSWEVVSTDEASSSVLAQAPQAQPQSREGGGDVGSESGANPPFGRGVAKSPSAEEATSTWADISTDTESGTEPVIQSGGSGLGANRPTLPSTAAAPGLAGSGSASLEERAPHSAGINSLDSELGANYPFVEGDTTREGLPSSGGGNGLTSPTVGVDSESPVDNFPFVPAGEVPGGHREQSPPPRETPPTMQSDGLDSGLPTGDDNNPFAQDAWETVGRMENSSSEEDPGIPPETPTRMLDSGYGLEDNPRPFAVWPESPDTAGGPSNSEINHPSLQQENEQGTAGSESPAGINHPFGGGGTGWSNHANCWETYNRTLFSRSGASVLGFRVFCTRGT